MSAEDRPGDLRSLLSLRTIPVYSIFALWSLGTGAQQLARPLFAASFGVPVFLVTVIAATNSLAWMVTAPVTGFLTDRWGRKPLVIAGNALRGLTTLAQFFAPGFWMFLVLEFIGGIGVSMWVTGASIIMADITSGENRGRANAIRSMSARLGMIAGPFVGGLLATFFPLRSIFLFNTLTKIPIHFITAYMIRETRPEAARGSRTPAASRMDRLGLTMFMSLSMLALALAVFALTLMSFTGVFGILFPLHARDAAGLSTAQIGNMMSLTGLIGIGLSYPNGYIMDRYGRKVALIAGMCLLTAAAYFMTRIAGLNSVLIMVLFYSFGQTMTMASSEVLAMDLAPTERRGAFLGIWQTFRNMSGFIGPLAAGGIAQQLGVGAAFLAIAGLLAASAVFYLAFGKETRRRVADTPPAAPVDPRG